MYSVLILFRIVSPCARIHRLDLNDSVPEGLFQIGFGNAYGPNFAISFGRLGTRPYLQAIFT
jgi:hypothetical protein